MRKPRERLCGFPGWTGGLREPDRRPIYEWAAEHITLPPSYGIPGRFDVTINRALIDVFDAIQDPFVRRIRFRKPPRFGGSLVADIAIPWIICNDPGPVMANFPKQEFADQRMKEKLWPLWMSCKPFTELLPLGRFDRTNTEIYFGPFFFLAQGIAPSNLQGKGIRWQFNDEVWLPAWQELYNQAVSRTRDYARTECEKVIDISQAGEEDDVEDRNWREGDQSVWCYQTRDGRYFPLKMGGKREDGSRWGLVWNEDAKRADGTWSRARAIETARYECRVTGQTWKDGPETIAEWNRNGMYVAQNPDPSPGVRSFATTGLLNNSFADLIKRKLQAMEQAERGDMSGMKDVKQQDECEPWREVYLTVELDGRKSGFVLADYANGELIDDERIRCITVDRQQGVGGDTPHRWVQVHAFRSDGTSKLLLYTRVETKEALAEIQERYKVKPKAVWCDAAFEKHEVFKECAQYGWVACFGSDQQSWCHRLPTNDRRFPFRKVYLPFSPWQQTAVGSRVVNYLYFSEDHCADILAAAYSGRGLKFEVPDDAPATYHDQMKGEHKVQTKRGWRWEKLHARRANHAFDTGKMAICFGLLMKLIAVSTKQYQPPAPAPAPAGG